MWSDTIRMSQDDLIRADGRTLQDYKQCCLRLQTLEAEADRQVLLLEKVCEFLRNDQDRFATGGLEEALSEKLIALMNDLRETRQRKKTLKKYLPD
jgi:hypothetical protein